MQDPFPIPSCFASCNKFPHDPTVAFSATKSGQSVASSVYRTKIAGHSRTITATWCRNLLVHSLCISIECPENSERINCNGTYANYSCKIELRPWYFWRKNTGSKKFDFQGKPVKVFWDLRRAKFSGDPEPRSGYHVAVVQGKEVVLVLGDLTKNEVSSSLAMLVCKKDHVFGKKRFSTRSKFGDEGEAREISIECGVSGRKSEETEMVVKIDGNAAIRVKHLRWKFRGNETITVGKGRVEVYWDVHDWLFASGLRHALFIFKPLPTTHYSMLASSSDIHGSCLFLYAWKL